MLGKMCILGRFPLKLGAKMDQKLNPSKSGFQHPISISNIIEVFWWGSGGKRSSDGLVVRVHVRYLCQSRPKIEAEHQSRTPKASISPQTSSEA